MPNKEHFQGLQRLYHAAACNRHYQPTLEVREGEAEVTIPVREQFYHAMGAAHGAVYMKALDDAAFFAANSLETEVFVLTAGLHVEFLRPVHKGEMHATGRVVDRTSRRIVAEAVAENQGREVARALGTFMPGRDRLDQNADYRGQ